MSRTDPNLESKLRYLRDIKEIEELKFRYNELCDRALQMPNAVAIASLGQLFTADATAEFAPTMKLKGRTAIEEFFGKTVPDMLAWSWHIVASPIIEIEGDKATGRWVAMAKSTLKEAPQAQPRVAYGRYVDEYVRTSEGWRQSALLFVNETRTGT